MKEREIKKVRSIPGWISEEIPGRILKEIPVTVPGVPGRFSEQILERMFKEEYRKNSLTKFLNKCLL